MFGNELLQKQQEVINAREEEKRREEAEKRKKALKYLKIIKEDLLMKANAGEKSLSVYYENNIEMSAYYESLRKMGWEDGINIIRNRAEFSYAEAIFAKVERVSIKKSYESIIQKRQGRLIESLSEKEIQYLRDEHEYALRIENGESVFEIQEEIAQKNRIDKKMAMLALANAAYKNGLDGEIPELEGVSKIEPTLKDVLKYNCDQYLVNYNEILHYIYKEKAAQKTKASEK